MAPGREGDETDDAPAQPLDDLDDDDDVFDPQLLDPAQWRDDDDLPLPDDPVTLDADPDELSTDEHGEETDDEASLAADTVPIDDDLDDLDATDQVDPVLLPWSPAVEIVAGGASRTVEAVIQPGLARTVWEAPETAPDAPEADVVLRIEGLAVPVRLRRARGDRERILLGRDVLAGRFLLRL